MTHARVLHPSNPDPTPPRYSLLGFLLTICVVSACRPHSSTIFGIAVGVLCKQLAAPTIGALAAARHFPTAAETLPARACTRLASTTRPAAAPPPFATPPPPPAPSGGGGACCARHHPTGCRTHCNAWSDAVPLRARPRRRRTMANVPIDTYRVEGGIGFSMPCVTLRDRRAGGQPPIRFVFQRHLETVLYGRSEGSSGPIWKLLNATGLGSTALQVNKKAVSDSILVQGVCSLWSRHLCH